jgi:hypothetical protein
MQVLVQPCLVVIGSLIVLRIHELIALGLVLLVSDGAAGEVRLGAGIEAGTGIKAEEDGHDVDVLGGCGG